MSAVLYVLGTLTGWCLAVALARLQRHAGQGPKPRVPTRVQALEGGPSLLQITARPAQWVASSKRAAAAGQQGDRNNSVRNTKLRQINQGGSCGRS